MQSMKTKHALGISIISIILCATMLIGGTYAWFTDQSSTASNSIVAGTLDVKLEWYDAANSTWKSAENEVLEFIDLDENNYWEPGCTYDLPKLRIKNNSNLALDYEVVISGIHGDEGLNAALEWEIIGDMEGSLLPSDTSSDEIFISAHMKETAGNEFQGMSMNGVTVTVYATQKAEESDSFGDDYDAAAKAVEVDTFAELQEVLNKGGYALLTADIDAATLSPKNQRLNVPAGVKATLDLNGHTLTDKDGGQSHWMAIFVDQGAELVIEDSVGTGKIVSSCYGIYVKQNAKVIMNAGKLVVSGNSAYDMGVVLYNGEFIMNGGTIDAMIGVCASNYYKLNDNTLPLNQITIGANATINAETSDFDFCTGMEDEASDTVVVDNRVGQ